MITRLLPKKLATLLFRSVEAREAFVHQVVELRQQYPNRPIAFALLGGGTIEYWAIRAFLRERFGQDFEPRMATRLPSLVVEDPKTILRRIASKIFINTKPRSRVRQCSDELLRGRPVVLNFDYTDRRRAFETPEGERELTFLAQRVPNLIVVPVVVLWRRKRLIRQVDHDLGHKILSGLLAPIKFPKDILLGDPTQPTFLRKIAILLRQYERSTFRLTTPIEIGATNVKMLRRRILQQIMQERKVVLGPQMSSPKFIGESILRSAAFTRIVRNLAQEEDVSELSLLKKSQRYFQEIAANFSYFSIETFGWFLSWVFSRVFNDLTFREEDFEKLRLSSREGPLLFLPCHKSYFDFLIMSYILFRNDIAPPHIAAGINLNFWPFGIFAKKSGAFFIRRSFRGNVLYSEILRRYIAALLQNRNNVEFFIEGARSRNGKLAPPKYGMLKMVVDSWYEGLIQEKVRIVPVSICYEKVTEVKSHKRELEGGEKVQESFVNLAKSSKVLFKKFGEVHVRIAEPIPMDHWLRQYVGEPDSVSPDSRKLGIQKLAFEVCHRINRTTPVSPEGLVCAVMLAKPGAAMAKAELEAWLLCLQADLQRMQTLLNPSLERDYMGACRRALAGLMEDRIIEKYQTSAGRTGLRVHHKQRIAALYYKNAAIHALLLPAVAGYAGHSQEDLLDLRSLLQFEFFFSEKEVFLKNLLHVPEGLMKELYAHMIEDVFENIAIGLTGLTEMAGTVLEDREWRARLMKFGKASVLESNVRRLEAVNTQSFSAFIEMAKNRKWLIPVASAKPGHFQTGALPEIQKALDKIRSFRGRLMEWDALRTKYLDVRHEEDLSPEGRA